MIDYLVIGKGLIGAAAARYLSQVAPNTAVIGPDEPADWRRHRGVFASHYNQDASPPVGLRAHLGAPGAGGHCPIPTIAAQSGVAFHAPVGGLYVAPAERVAHYSSTSLGTSLVSVAAAPPSPAVEGDYTNLLERAKYAAEDYLAHFPPQWRGAICWGR
jgi:glycine/D-amino acid oxidase-like deaminating enzyme